MKKNFLKRINLLLGTVSVALAGCHVQKTVAEQQPNDNEAPQPVIEETNPIPEAICLYGVPVEDYAQPAPKYGVPRPVPERE